MSTEFPSADEAFDKLTQALSAKLGHEITSSSKPLLHPQAIPFDSDEPELSFNGFSESTIYSSKFSLEIGGTNWSEHRIERLGNYVVYASWSLEIDDNRVQCFDVQGQALACAQGSDNETVFVTNALSCIMQAAAQPLIIAMKEMKRTGLELSPSAEESLKEECFRVKPAGAPRP